MTRPWVPGLARCAMRCALCSVTLAGCTPEERPATPAAARARATPAPRTPDPLETFASQIPAQKPDAARLQWIWNEAHFYIEKARHLRETYPESPARHTALTNEYEKIRCAVAALRSGEAPEPPSGLREEAYCSESDGSFQPFLRYLPFDAGARMPLIVFLHGYSPYLDVVNWGYLPNSLVEFAEAGKFALLAPFGRGNTDFQGIGEQDVLNAIAEMRGRYRIDEERIILSGISMGGMGVWTIGAHYPDRFAGLVVVSGRGDYYFWQRVAREDVPSYKRALIDAEFGHSLLGNFARLPIFAIHGAMDSLVPVAEARHMAEAARRVRADLTYVEIPDGDHWIYEEAFGRDDLRDWLRARRRQSPARFEYTTGHPMYNACHWLSAAKPVRRGFPGSLAGRVEDGKVRVDAAGFRSVTVHRNRMPGEIRALPVEGSGQAEVWDSDGPAPARTGAACGPAKQAFLGPFVFVEGTWGNKPEAGRFARRVLEWYRYAKAMPRVLKEAHATPEKLAEYNVFVFGEPESSALVRQVFDTAPVKVTESEFVVGRLKFPRSGHGLFLTFRSPWNPAKLAVVQCGLVWGEGIPENHKYDFIPDYIVYAPERDVDGSNRALCAGFFDEQWRLDPALMYLAPTSAR